MKKYKNSIFFEREGPIVKTDALELYKEYYSNQIRSFERKQWTEGRQTFDFANSSHVLSFEDFIETTKGISKKSVLFRKGLICNL